MSISTRIAGIKAMMHFDNRWQLIANRLLFRSDIDIYHLKGCRIIVDHVGGDAAGIRECLTSNMYRQLIPHMDLSGPLTILDCGANSGGFPLLLHTEGHDISRSVCVEMNPFTYSRLHYNLKSNLNGTVHCLNLIVEDSSSEKVIRFGKGSTGDSILSESKNGTKVSIKSTSVNELISNYLTDKTIDICKIDIEGAEYAVFTGSKYSLLTQSRYIIIEIHRVPGHDPSEVINSISSLGFKLVCEDKQVYLFSNNNSGK